MKQLLLTLMFFALLLLHTFSVLAFIPPADIHAPIPKLMSNTSSVALVQQASMPAHERTLFESMKEFLVGFFAP